MTRRAILRRSADRFIAKLFGVNRATARAVRIGIEKKYGKVASKKLIQKHPVIVKRQVTTAEKKQVKPKQTPAKPKEKKVEYVLHFDYGSRKTRNLIRFQVHLIGPRVPDREAIKVTRNWERTGSVPSGWTQREIYWGHPKTNPEMVGEHPTARTEAIQGTTLNLGRAQVRRKGPIS